MYDLISEGEDVEKWLIGVFISIDVGLGVKLEVVYELGVLMI